MAKKQQSKGAAPSSRSTNDKPPAFDKLLIPSIILVFLMIAWKMFTAIATPKIDLVDVNDELLLREVFFGETGAAEPRNFVVLCHPSDSEYPMPSAFVDAAPIVGDNAK
jgi:hypothetical protein